MAKKDDAKPEAEAEGAEKEDKKAKKKKGKEEEPSDDGEGGEGTAAPKKSKKKIVIFGLVAILLVAAGGGGWYFMNKRQSTASAGAAGGTQSSERGVFYTLPEFLVNLNTGGKQVSYLKTTIVLQVGRQTDIPLVEANLPKLFDTLNTYMRELRSSDLAGSAGIQRLREELLARSNKVLWPVKVEDVLFREIVVQ